jgi:hypothetical protein
MARYVTDDGQIYDTETGVISGQVEAPVAQNKLDIPTTAMDVARQASYAFNAALFTLPDAAVRRIGKGLGMEEGEVQTLTKIFNKGDRGPKNAAERYARAIGGAIGANMPITGVLGYMATGLSKPFGAASQAFAALLKTYIEQGKLGEKTGEGFYSYPNPRYREADFTQ